MIIACNWKMNMNTETALDLVADMATQMAVTGVQRIIFPPFPLLAAIHMRIAGTDILMGGQDCHTEQNGAFTGDVSASMLSDVGCKWVIIGHSERRQLHHETNDLIAAKVAAAQLAGLSVMLCVGETEQDRRAGASDVVVLDMLASSLPADIDPTRLAIAYEPVWAIGTGQNASEADISAMHNRIAVFLAASNMEHVPVLYGGSVNPDNAAAIMAMASVGGVLVGGASLDANSIKAITDQSAPN
ncbi:MAG: triose-phosphate isomerase [Alphaproteobacteria bacterium]|nr:triose-phosphate isomerase [Alphaproteobacteria bacterium]